MGRRGGFISIIALIIMSVLLIMVIYLGTISELGHLILNSNNSKTQGYYQSEGKLYLSLYDDKYYKNQLYLHIIDVFRKNNFATTSKSVIIENLDLDYDDNEKNVRLEFYEKDNRVGMDIIARSRNNDIVTGLTSSGTLVKKIFEMEYSILSDELVDEEYKDELENILFQINDEINVDNCYRPESLFGIDFKQYSEIVFKKKDSINYELNSKRETMTDPYTVGFKGREAIIIARKPENQDLNFFIGEPDNPSSDIELTGVLYINGNLIISDNFRFKGILIVENGEIIINTSNGPKISGLVILNNIENYNDFIEKTDIIRDKRMIYRYGTYLPGFLDPKISVIKGN